MNTDDTINILQNKVAQLEREVAELKLKIQLFENSTDTSSGNTNVPHQSTNSTSKTDYSEIPGVIGTFDGFNLVTVDNNKFEVPENYAAKSRLVYGDKLKMIEDDGKNLFKIIQKVEKEKVSGILLKKEDVWYLKTRDNEYLVPKVGVEFYNATEGLPAIGIIPKDNPNVPYAALDTVKQLDVPEITPNSGNMSTRVVEDQLDESAHNTLNKIPDGKISLELDTNLMEHAVALKPESDVIKYVEPDQDVAKIDMAIKALEAELASSHPKDTSPNKPNEIVQNDDQSSSAVKEQVSASSKENEKDSEKAKDKDKEVDLNKSSAGNRVLEDFDLV